MLNRIMKTNIHDVMEAAKTGENITVIINGEYYELDLKNDSDLRGQKNVV